MKARAASKVRASKHAGVICFTLTGVAEEMKERNVVGVHVLKRTLALGEVGEQLARLRLGHGARERHSPTRDAMSTLERGILPFAFFTCIESVPPWHGMWLGFTFQNPHRFHPLHAGYVSVRLGRPPYCF